MMMIFIISILSFLLIITLILLIRWYIVSCTIRSNRQRSKELVQQLQNELSNSNSSATSPDVIGVSFMNNNTKNKIQKPLRTLIVLGSGGHTSEILFMTQYLNDFVSSSTTTTLNGTINTSTNNSTTINDTEMKKHVEQLNLFDPIYYCKASTDTTSQDRLQHTIMNRDQHNNKNTTITTTISPTVQIYNIPRSREVGQSYISSIYTTIIALLYSMKLLYILRPNVLICNGPGTCIPLCIILTIYRICNIVSNRDTYIVFIESFCRVQSLSLSGKILYYMYLLPADIFILHWKELYNLYPNGTIVTNTYINE